ncbi:uncharacterized protein ACBR49_019054 [Aulostomus maculatus]
MPLFRASDEYDAETRARRRTRRRKRKTEWMRSDEDGCVVSLTQLCLLNLADNMKDVWVKDYADNYLDHYSFRHIMGPFTFLPSDLVEELTWLLCTRRQLSRAALHLLLVPQLRALSLEGCPGLATSALCTHIAARCQALCSLDLSGAQQLPSKAQSETLRCLPALRSLSLAGTPCDRCVIGTIAHHCPLLRNLDVSDCRSLSPADLLPLGLGAFCSLSDSPSFHVAASISPTRSDLVSSASMSPLCSLLALDIGLGGQEGDSVAATAYLLLSLPCLERVALEGLSQACHLIQHREFHQTDEFAVREGLPQLEDLWREKRHSKDTDSWRKKREEVDEEGSVLWEGYSSEEDEEVSREESCCQNPAKWSRERVSPPSGNKHLHLRDVKGLTCDSLGSLGCLCPDICSLSVYVDPEDASGRRQGSLLAEGLQTWSGQLQRLSVRYPGPLGDLLPALQVAGSSLVSLTLEAVKTNRNTPLLEVIRACPKLRDLLISAEPPTTAQEEEDDEGREEQELPGLPDLCSLSLNFSYEHNQMRPVMSWMTLRRVIRRLLTGSPSLEKLSLVSLPCPLNSVLRDALSLGGVDQHHCAAPTNSAAVPLRRVKNLNLPRTDVEMTTVKSLMQRSKKLKYVDVSYCWRISQLEWWDCERLSKAEVVWV